MPTFAAYARADPYFRLIRGALGELVDGPMASTFLTFSLTTSFTRSFTRFPAGPV